MNKRQRKKLAKRYPYRTDREARMMRKMHQVAEKQWQAVFRRYYWPNPGRNWLINGIILGGETND